jgi:hypothetical protein
MTLIDVVKWDISEGKFCYKHLSKCLKIGSQLVEYLYPMQAVFFKVFSVCNVKVLLCNGAKVL